MPALKTSLDLIQTQKHRAILGIDHIHAYIHVSRILLLPKEMTLAHDALVVYVPVNVDLACPQLVRMNRAMSQPGTFVADHAMNLFKHLGLSGGVDVVVMIALDQDLATGQCGNQLERLSVECHVAEHIDDVVLANGSHPILNEQLGVVLRVLDEAAKFCNRFVPEMRVCCEEYAHDICDLAGSVGFEPTEGLTPSSVFKTDAISRSANCP